MVFELIWMVASNQNYFLLGTAIRSGSKMLVTSKKELFVAIAYTESH